MIKNILLAVFSLSIFTVVLAQGQKRDFSVTSVQPSEAKSIDGQNAYVVGLDAKIRSCPKEYNMYVRPEGKEKRDDFYYVPMGKTLFPNKDVNYTAVCLKVIP